MHSRWKLPCTVSLPRSSSERASEATSPSSDGQMMMHRVEILSEGRKADVADVRITRDFRHDEQLSFRGAHGYTRVSKVTKIAGGREKEGGRRPGRGGQDRRRGREQEKTR